MTKTHSRRIGICSLVCVCFAILLGSGCKRTQSNTNAISPGSASVPATNSKTESVTLLEKGKELYKNDQDSEAAKVFERVLAFDPDFAEAHFRLGLCYDSMNKAEQAETEYKRAVESYKKYVSANPDDAEAFYQFGQVYAALHQYSDAVRSYRQAIKLKEDDADIYYDLGVSLMKLAQYDEAVAAFSKALEIDPENYRAEDALAEAQEGVKRIKAGRKHQEDLLKKQKEEELKKAGETNTDIHAAPTPGAAVFEG